MLVIARRRDLTWIKRLPTGASIFPRMNSHHRRIFRFLSFTCASILLGGCGQRAPNDPYDAAKMDLKPVPAKISAERHQGAFADGAALSLGAELKPLDPSPVKTVRLDTMHKIIEIAPGVNFSAWTFGNQVPGPTIRARVGDKIRFSMTNRSDEAVPGVQLTAAPMMHSMDFHAAMVSPQDKYRSIAPGQTIEFEFTPNYPGIFMYHCGTPMILEHIASGMYGAVVVEPKGGYPTKVDREYVVVQRASSTPSPIRASARRAARRSTFSTPSGCALRSPRIRCSTACTTACSRRHSPPSRASACGFTCSTSARARPRAFTSSAPSSTAYGSRAIRTTSSAACRRCCSDPPTARRSSS